MPYTTPPTFVDDSVLSAAQLNILADDIEYLNGLSQSVNIPFARVTENLTTAGSYWQCRHRTQYLNVYVDWGVDPSWVDHLDLDIYIDGNNVHSEELTGTSTKYVSIDVDAIGSPPASGDWYEIEVDVVAKDGSDNYASYHGATYIYVSRIFEADSAA